MSCCGGNCGCGNGCKCGSGCTGCKMYANLSYTEGAATREAIISDVKAWHEAVEMEVALAENGGCKCGTDCKCDPCTCK